SSRTRIAGLLKNLSTTGVQKGAGHEVPAPGNAKTVGSGRDDRGVRPKWLARYCTDGGGSCLSS
ncbi:MAG: hypothetical protein AB2541_01320, partial [Candidatus Thiodiazotropha sp.]